MKLRQIKESHSSFFQMPAKKSEGSAEGIPEINKLFDLRRIKYKVNSNGEYDIMGDFSISALRDYMGPKNSIFVPDGSKLRIKFGTVTGYFDISSTFKLKSLEGCPRSVGENFDCSYNLDLKSLVGGPKQVGGDYDCHESGIRTLKGAPERIDGAFVCSHCENLVSLKGGPKEVTGHFRCEGCEKLDSLEGAPVKVGTFECDEKFTKDEVKEVSKVRSSIINGVDYSK